MLDAGTLGGHQSLHGQTAPLEEVRDPGKNPDGNDVAAVAATKVVMRRGRARVGFMFIKTSSGKLARMHFTKRTLRRQDGFRPEPALNVLKSRTKSRTLE